MKIIKSIFYSLFAMAVMAGCSDQIDIEEQQQLIGDDGDGVYMGLDIQLPYGDISRSTTVVGGGSSDGVEVGSDAENAVSSALIILAQRNTHAFIAAAEVASNRLTANNSKATYKAVAKISKTNLNQFYEQNVTPGQEPVVEIFVFCNPTKQLVDDMSVNEYGDTDWTNWTADVFQGNPEKPDYNVGIWSANSFLMNNVSIVTRALPKDLLVWENFNKVENPFHLSNANAIEGKPDIVLPDNSELNSRGAIRVQRSVARFDFKDGSAKGDQVYNVLFQADPENPEDVSKQIPIVAVKLQKMCLVNMSNKFYFLPRVSNNGLNSELSDAGTTNGWALCGIEKPWGRNEQTGSYTDGNYVVGPYAGRFSRSEGYVDITNYYEFFNFPFFDENGSFNNGLETKNQWDVYDIETVLKGSVKDNYKGASNYTVWRYVTENVIPAPRASQVNGISTGIVFRARLKGSEEALSGAIYEESWEEDVYKNLALCLDGKEFEIRRTKHAPISGVDNNGVSHDPILYYYEGKLYFTWEHMRQAAIQASVTPTWDGDKIVSVEINRSNSIYRAVFGDGPIPDGQKYIKDGEKGQANAFDFTDPRWDSDTNSAEYKLYAASCDYAWNVWKNAGEYVGTITGGDAEKLEPIIAMRKVMTETAGITIYQSSLDPSSTPGYYCYYYYWNRHNDNNIAGVMGPMEFDVVRNNVYKLSVDKISRLGHPRIPENDPENPTPETPDESADIYIDVTVEVADWAVRLNSIVF